MFLCGLYVFVYFTKLWSTLWLNVTLLKQTTSIIATGLLLLISVYSIFEKQSCLTSLLSESRGKNDSNAFSFVFVKMYQPW